MSAGLYIKGHSALFCGTDETPHDELDEKGAVSGGGIAAAATLAVPNNQEKEIVDEIEEEVDCWMDERNLSECLSLCLWLGCGYSHRLFHASPLNIASSTASL